VLQVLPSNDLLKDTIGFTGAPFGDPQANVPTQGTAQGVTRYLGPDYLLNGMLIFTFVQDAAAEGGFRIDFTTATALGVDIDRLVQLTEADRAIAVAPLNLDRLTFQLVVTMGLPSVALTPLVQQPGPTPGKVRMVIDNQGSGPISVAFFGPTYTVVQVLVGQQLPIELDPGYYEYLVAPPSSTSRPLLGQQTFTGGALYNLQLTGA
jgi:hypothetical protein